MDNYFFEIFVKLRNIGVMVFGQEILGVEGLEIIEKS